MVSDVDAPLPRTLPVNALHEDPVVSTIPSPVDVVNARFNADVELTAVATNDNEVVVIALNTKLLLVLAAKADD